MCSDGGDSSALLGQTLFCSGIVFTLELKVPVRISELTGWALGTSIGDEDVEKESMLQFVWINISSQTLVSSVV